MVLNGWLAAPLRPAYDWVGPEHNTRDIRALKYHLVSGGLAFLQRSVAEIAVLISNGSHGRTSDAGTVLNVTVHPSSPISALSDEIGLLGGAFLSRTAIPNGVLPSVRYYALALTDLAPPSPSFLEYWSQRIHRIANWARAIGSTSICMSPQGWLVASAVTHPAASFPFLTVEVAASLHFSNMAFWEALGVFVTAIKDAVLAASTLVHQITGGASLQTWAMVVMLYLLVICGLSSGFGLVMLFARWFTVTTQQRVRLSGTLIPPPPSNIAPSPLLVQDPQPKPLSTTTTTTPHFGFIMCGFHWRNLICTGTACIVFTSQTDFC